MNKDEIEKIATVIPINEDSSNIIFINNYLMSVDEMHKLAVFISKSKPNFGCIVAIRGNPHDAVKLISAEYLDKLKEK